MLNGKNEQREFFYLSDRDPDSPNAGIWVDKGQLRMQCRIRHAWARTIHTFQVSSSLYEPYTGQSLDIVGSPLILLLVFDKTWLCIGSQVVIFLSESESELLLVTRQNDNHTPGPGPGRLVSSSHQRSELSNSILGTFSRGDNRVRK